MAAPLVSAACGYSLALELCSGACSYGPPHSLSVPEVGSQLSTGDTCSPSAPLGPLGHSHEEDSSSSSAQPGLALLRIIPCNEEGPCFLRQKRAQRNGNLSLPLEKC